MKILIIGTGNVGTAMAADLTLKGHEITMLKTTNKIGNTHFQKILDDFTITFKDIDKEEKKVKIKCITDDYEEALKKEPQIIIICIQTNYHEEIIKKISKYLNHNQIVLLEPGYLSTAYILKYCDEKDMPIVVEAESSPIDCRITGDGEVTALFRNVRNPIGIFPMDKSEKTFKILEENLQYNFKLEESVVAAALHNPNLIVHTIGAIMSIPRIEYTKGEYWMYKEVFTGSVWSMVEKLDNEKIQVLQKLNLKPLKYVEACKYRNSKDLNVNAKEIFFDYANNSAPKGPNVSDSRYITEDVTQGLVLLESLGKILDISTPVTTSLIEIAGACLNMDFRKKGRTVEKLGVKNLEKVIGKKYIPYKEKGK